MLHETGTTGTQQESRASYSMKCHQAGGWDVPELLGLQKFWHELVSLQQHTASISALEPSHALSIASGFFPKKI